MQPICQDAHEAQSQRSHEDAFSGAKEIDLPRLREKKQTAKEKAKSVIIDIRDNSKLFTWEDLKKDNIKVMEINYQNADYYGQVKEGNDGSVIRNGKGVLKYHSGRIYEGTWVDDLREGDGYERFEKCNDC